MSLPLLLPCLNQQNTIKLVVIINIIVALLAGLHFGYCGIMSSFVAMYKNQQYGMQNQYNQMKILYESPIAYYSITGCFQIITSIGVILFACNCIKRNNCVLSWVMLGLLNASLMLNFAIAVICSMNVGYYFQLFKKYFDNLDMYQNTYLAGYVIKMKTFTNYRLAETIITFTVILPLIAITIVSFLYYYMRDAQKQQLQNQTIVAMQQTNHNIENKNQIQNAQDCYNLPA